MIALDHIAVVAPDVEAGEAWVRDVLGLEPQPGGKHPEMGTHNRLMRLGADLFLEIIAADPAAQRGPHRRWYGLDDPVQVRRDWRDGRRLRAWVARTDATLATDAFSKHAALFGTPMQISRGDRRWLFSVRADGSLPADGALPHLIDWGEAGTPAPAMADLGCRLAGLVIETPEPKFVATTLGELGIAEKPLVRLGKTVRLFAMIDTPHGVRLLS